MSLYGEVEQRKQHVIMLQWSWIVATWKIGSVKSHSNGTVR